MQQLIDVEFLKEELEILKPQKVKESELLQGMTPDTAHADNIANPLEGEY